MNSTEMDTEHQKIKTILYVRIILEKLLLTRPYSEEYYICFPAHIILRPLYLSYWLQLLHRQYFLPALIPG